MAAIQRSISGLDVPIYCSADASASPMLSPTREADALTVSRARCAYRAVVRTWVWPSSFPIIGRLSPSPTAREAKAVTQLTDVGRRPHVRRVGRAGLLGALTAEKEGVSGYRRTRPRDRHARGRRPCPRAQTRRARALVGTVLAGGFDVDVCPSPNEGTEQRYGAEGRVFSKRSTSARRASSTSLLVPETGSV